MQGRELVWLCGASAALHGSTSAKAADSCRARSFSGSPTGRGGQYTYHGPASGWLCNARPQARAPTAPLRDALEAWLHSLHLERLQHPRERRREDRVCVGARRTRGSLWDKIAAIGIRVQPMGHLHGISLNVSRSFRTFPASPLRRDRRTGSRAFGSRHPRDYARVDAVWPALRGVFGPTEM
jgi:lipoyl(octanoyl) transferase